MTMRTTHLQRSSAVFCFILILALPCPGQYTIDDAVLYKIKFPKKVSEDVVPPFGTSNEEQTASTSSSDSDQNDYETIVTENNERYTCIIPKFQPSKKVSDENYEGPNALEILRKLFVTKTCAYRMEHYWTYELCHGRYIRQYHEERDGKNVKTTEYILGKYDSETLNQESALIQKHLKEGTLKKPHKMRIESMNMPYYELLMTDGTVCDINGRPRITRVKYVCYSAGKHEIFSFKESSTCEYEVVILSRLLCEHPDYVPETSEENEISCKPSDEKTPSKPQILVNFEEENLKMRSTKMFEGNFMQGDEPGTVQIEIKPVKPQDPFDEDDDAIIEEEEGDQDQNKEKNWRSSNHEPIKSLMDPEIVKEFLRGDYCLYGGTGWWKYELCYGKKVVQYHEEANGKRTVITLGLFDEAKHLEWLAQNPSKKPKPSHVRKHVSHFYSDGDICDITKKPRTVEVKLKCKKSDSVSAVSLYLLEPKTCEYILGVESPLVCDIINTVDEETGFMTLSEDAQQTSKDQQHSTQTTSTPPKYNDQDGARLKRLKELNGLTQRLSSERHERFTKGYQDVQQEISDEDVIQMREWIEKLNSRSSREKFMKQRNEIKKIVEDVMVEYEDNDTAEWNDIFIKLLEEYVYEDEDDDKKPQKS